VPLVSNRVFYWSYPHGAPGGRKKATGALWVRRSVIGGQRMIRSPTSPLNMMRILEAAEAYPGVSHTPRTPTNS